MVCKYSSTAIQVPAGDLDAAGHAVLDAGEGIPELAALLGSPRDLERVHVRDPLSTDSETDSVSIGGLLRTASSRLS